MPDSLTLMAAPAMGCMILSILYTYFGVHVLKREIIFVDLSMAQLAALGTTVGFVFELEGSLSSLIFSFGFILIGAAFFTWTRSVKLRVPQEAIIGIVYIVGASLGLLLASRSPHGAEHIRSLLNGSILWMSWKDILSLGVVGVLVAVIHRASRDRFQIQSESYKNSQPERIIHPLWEFLFYSALGLVIVFSVEKAGIFLIFTYLIIPAVCGAFFTANMKIQFYCGVSLALTVSMVGLFLSYALDLPTGATLVCSFGAAFLIALIASRISKAGS